MLVATLHQEGHQRADHQDRLEALAHQDHERLREDAGGREPVRDGPLGPLQCPRQPLADPGKLLRRGAPAGAGPEQGERRLNLGGERGVLDPELALDLFERHVRVHRGGPRFLRPAGPGQVIRAVQLPPHLGEDGGREVARLRLEGADRRQPGAIGAGTQRGQHGRIAHSCARREGAERGGDVTSGPREPEDRGVEGDGPAVLGGERVLVRRHRGAGGAHRDPAVKIERRAPPLGVRLGEIGRPRRESGRLRPVTPAARPVAGGAGGLIHLPAARQRRDRLRDLVQHEMQLVTERGDQVRCVPRHRIRLREVRDQRIEPVDRRPGPGGSRLRYPIEVASRLGEEESRLVDLRPCDHPAAAHAESVLLGRELHRGGDPTGRRSHVLRGSRRGSQNPDQEARSHRLENHSQMIIGHRPESRADQSQFKESNTRSGVLDQGNGSRRAVGVREGEGDPDSPGAFGDP